jgi:hypothetical protein
MFLTGLTQRALLSAYTASLSNGGVASTECRFEGLRIAVDGVRSGNSFVGVIGVFGVGVAYEEPFHFEATLLDQYAAEFAARVN